MLTENMWQNQISWGCKNFLPQKWAGKGCFVLEMSRNYKSLSVFFSYPAPHTLTSLDQLHVIMYRITDHRIIPALRVLQEHFTG